MKTPSLLWFTQCGATSTRTFANIMILCTTNSSWPVHLAIDIGHCELSCKTLPLLPTSKVQPWHRSGSRLIIFFLLFDPMYSITSRVTPLQYHGPNTMESIKQAAKTIDPLHYYKKEGLRLILKPLHHVVYSNFSISWSTSCFSSFSTTHSAPQNAVFLPKTRPSWVAPNSSSCGWGRGGGLKVGDWDF